MPAWAIDRLARRRELDVQRLLKAGERLREVQTEAVLGQEGGEAFREARRDEQAAIEQLVEAAKGLLQEAGHSASDATLDRIATTLRAAAVVDEYRDLLRSGRLVEELQPQGFDAFVGLPIERARPRRTTRSPKAGKAERVEAERDHAAERRLEDARSKVFAARAEARDRAKEAKQAERRVEEARRLLEQAESAAERSRTQAERAKDRLERAEGDLRRLK